MPVFARLLRDRRPLLGRPAGPQRLRRRVPDPGGHVPDAPDRRDHRRQRRDPGRDLSALARAESLLRPDHERREPQHPRHRLERDRGHGSARDLHGLDRRAPEHVPEEDGAEREASDDHDQWRSATETPQLAMVARSCSVPRSSLGSASESARRQTPPEEPEELRANRANALREVRSEPAASPRARLGQCHSAGAHPLASAGCCSSSSTPLRRARSSRWRRWR